MKFLDLFAGIGGFRLGMEAAGHECVGYVEWDKFARKSYEAIHNTEGEWTAHDITTVTNDDLRSLRGKVDIICGGFPCQAFSIAGKRLGFAETRGTLFFEIARFAKEIQPQYLFLENVKGLLNHEGGNTFRTILSTLDELGYDAEWQVLNSKNFGVPQNRERVFIIGHLRGSGGREVFPIRETNKEPGEPMFTLTAQDRHGVAILTPKRTEYGKEVRKQYESGEVQEKRKNMTSLYPREDGISNTITTVQKDNLLLVKEEPKILDDQGRRNKKHKLHSVCPTLRAQTHGNEPKVLIEPFPLTEEGNTYCLTTRTHACYLPRNAERKETTLVKVREATKKGYAEAEIGDSINFSVPNSKTRRGRVGKGVAQTLDTSCNQATIDNKPPYRIRKLTPRECWRLQGFPDWAFDRAREVNSDSQLYKQAGNSVTVNVIHAIAERLV